MRGIQFNHLLKSLIVATGLTLAGCSTFHLSSAPEADVYENGERVGRTPLAFNLLSGNRVFVLKKYGYVEENVVVTAMDSKRLHYDLHWVGRTRVESQPPGAEVRTRKTDELLGVTPVGLHLARSTGVVLKLKGYESVERDLTPNKSYVIELKPKSGYKSAHYKTIRFTSTRGAVEIHDRVAGELIGVTPVELKLEAGAALEYRQSGHVSKFDLISRNAAHNMIIDLEPLKLVTITGANGAELFRAGGVERLGTLPFVIEVGGDMLFEIHKEGFHTRSIGVSKGSPNRLRVALTEVKYKTIVTQPKGGEVYRLGGLEKLGDTPFETVVENERVFEVRLKGHKPKVIGLGPDSPSQTLVPLNPAPRDDPDAAAIGTIDSENVNSF